jgi:hypothetical protein
MCNKDETRPGLYLISFEFFVKMTETRGGSRNRKNWSQDQDEIKGFIKKKKRKRKG